MLVKHLAFIYDGWNMVGEYQQTQAGTWEPVRAYLWGDDLSNTAQGAGGVGGLLAVRRFPAAGPGPAWLIPFYGANGNITAWMDGGAPAASTPPQTMAVARWNYTPFGERFGDEAAKGAELCPHRVQHEI